MSNIPQSRLILYLLIAGLLPVFFVVFNFTTKMNAVDGLKNRLEDMAQQALIRDKKQSLNMIVRKHYSQADHFYIDKHLETLNFLEDEVETLHKISSNSNVGGFFLRVIHYYLLHQKVNTNKRDGHY